MTYHLPETGYLRLSQIVGNPKADPPISPLIPVSKSTWWVGVKDGRFPKPVKLGPRITAWRMEDIRALIECTRMCSGKCPAICQFQSARPEMLKPPVAAGSRGNCHE